MGKIKKISLAWPTRSYFGKHKYLRYTLYLKPASNYEEKMTYSTVGIGFVDRTDICEGFVVNWVLKGSDPELRGIRSGDVITHFESKAVNENSEKMIKEFYDVKNKAVKVTFSRKDSVFVIPLQKETKL